MLEIRAVEEKDRIWVKKVLENLWGSEEIVYNGQIFHAAEIPGFIAFEKDRPLGLLTYVINAEDKECQIISLNSLMPGIGIGTSLIEKIKVEAKKALCERLFVVTTNDNLNALKFYQKRGFVFKEVRPNEVERSRQLRPSISIIGEEGLPIRDELELEMGL